MPRSFITESDVISNRPEDRTDTKVEPLKERPSSITTIRALAHLGFGISKKVYCQRLTEDSGILMPAQQVL